MSTSGCSPSQVEYSRTLVRTKGSRQGERGTSTKLQSRRCAVDVGNARCQEISYVQKPYTPKRNQPQVNLVPKDDSYSMMAKRSLVHYQRTSLSSHLNMLCAEITLRHILIPAKMQNPKDPQCDQLQSELHARIYRVGSTLLQ